MCDSVTYETYPCPKCGERSKLEVNLSGLMSWQTGTHIQNALPDLSPEDRETMITGFHAECWDEDFEDIEDEGY